MTLDDKCRVAYLTHGVRNVGGGEKTLYFLVKYLNRDIFEPVVFYNEKNKIIQQLEDEGISIYQIPLSSKITSVYRDEIRWNPIVFASYVWHMLIGMFSVYKGLKEKKVNIFHPHDNLSKIIGVLPAKICGVPVVAHCHDLLGNSFIEKALIYYQLVFFDNIIAVSEAVLSRLRVCQKTPESVRKIYNGIDIRQFTPLTRDTIQKRTESREKCVVLGIIASFDACKGHVHLFRAIKSLVSEGASDLVCLIIGRGREERALKEFVQTNGLCDYIKFLGYRNDIVALLQQIDIIVIPSTKEAFGIVAIEAMAMAVPVIASNVGGLPECVEDGTTGIIFPPGDIQSLSEAISYLIDNPDRRARMGQAGRQRVIRLFNVERNVRETEKVYLDVIRNFCNSLGRTRYN